MHSRDDAAGRTSGQSARITAALIRACHPGPTLAVTTVSALLAVAVGHDAPGVLRIVAAVVAGQLSIGWSNDWLDAERDVSIGRIDKPTSLGQIDPTTLRWMAIAAAAACIPLSLATGIRPGSLHVLAVAAGWAYNLGFKATALSVLPYAVAFGLLPAFIVEASPGASMPPPWLIAAGALLGAGAHFANVMPDLEDDLATGVRGLGQRLGRSACGALAATLLLAAVAALVLGPPGAPSTTGLAVAGVTAVVGVAGVVAGRRPGSRAMFTAVMLIAVTAVALMMASGATLR